MDIGKEKEIVTVEPLEDPFKGNPPAPAKPEEQPAQEPEPVEVGS